MNMSHALYTTLNIFIRHCDRVVMANLAQTANVLEAVILTEGERMTLPPTYHVFDLSYAGDLPPLPVLGDGRGAAVV